MRSLSVPRRPAAVATALLALLLAGAAPVSEGPERPREGMDTAPVTPTGRTIAVRAGGDLQAALDAARPGDVITLPAGATFRGPFTLPRKSGAGWIVVRSADEAALPRPGTRVTRQDAAHMPRLESPQDSVIGTAPGAHHYRFVGLEIRPVPGSFLWNVVQLGGGETRADDTPHHIVFDRCFIHGDPRKGSRRGIALNSRSTAVIDSIVADFKEEGADTQALCGWNGPGPFVIVNNELAAAGENVMFGGADPTIPGLVPSDITVRRNHFVKPLQWKQGRPEFEGTNWVVKNLFELKSGRRVLIDGNLFENNWAAAQAGFAIVLTVRNQDGGAPWVAVEDVIFANNVVRGTGSGVNLLGYDDGRPKGNSGPTRRIWITNNLFEDIGGPAWGGNGILFQVLQGTSDVTIEHNTGLQQGSIIMADGLPHRNFVFRDNIVRHNEYGIDGSGTGSGLPTLRQYFPGAVVKGNVIVGGAATLYPGGNAFPSAPGEIGFADAARDDYSLGPKSRFCGSATDGGDPGADIAALRKALGDAAQGRTGS